MALAKIQDGPDQNLSSENACTTKIKLSTLTGLHVDMCTCIRCADGVLRAHVVIMAAIIISSGSEMSDSDDSEFEREIKEAKRRSILECRLNGNRNVGERSIDAVGEISETMKVIIVLYLAPTGLVSDDQTAFSRSLQKTVWPRKNCAMYA